jgi:hypothetical protein
VAIDSTGTVYFTDSGPFGTLPLSLVVMRPRHLQQSPALRNLLADGYVVGRRDDTGIAQGFCLLHQVRARMLCGRRPAWRPLFPRLPACCVSCSYDILSSRRCLATPVPQRGGVMYLFW